MGRPRVFLGAAMAALVGIAASAGVTMAADTKAAPQCFRSSDWRGWKATQDAKTMYIEAGLNRVYRLDLAFACPALNDIDAKLVTRTRGSNWICYPMDIDMRVFRPGIGASTYCKVKRVTRLGASEAKALPRELRP